jgi:putative membrane protein
MKRASLRRILPVALLAVAATLGGGIVYAQGWGGPGYGMGPGMMWGYGYGGGWGVFGTLLMLLWWVLIILGIVVLVRWLFGARRGGSAAEDRALAILRERYARGEIDKTEYEARKKDLSP